MIAHRRSCRAGSARLVLLLAALAAAIVAAVWILSQPAAQPTVDAGRDVADDFLAQIREGHPDDAWEATTAEFKSAQGKESFVRKLKPMKHLAEPLQFVSMQTVTVGDDPRSEFLYQGAGGETVRIVLGREEGEWKVDRWTAE